MIRVPGQGQIDVYIDLLLLLLLLMQEQLLVPLLLLQFAGRTGLEDCRRNLRNKLVLTFAHVATIVVGIILGLRSEILEIGRNRYCRQMVLRLRQVAWRLLLLLVVSGLIISGH